MSRRVDEVYLYPLGWVDEEARSFAATARQWAEREILSDRLAYQQDYARLFMEKRRTLSVEIGFQRLVLPEEHGGYGWNTPASAPGILTVFSEIGRADAAIGLVTALNYALFATVTMKPNLDEELCNALAPQYCADEIRTLAVILPGAGQAGRTYPLFKGRAIPLRLSSTKEGYRVEGREVRPLGFGHDADLFCAVCADKDGRACLAFIPADAPGVRKGQAVLETGITAGHNGDVSFEKVSLPKGSVITREGAVCELYSWLNLLLAGVSLGAAMNFHEILDDWAASRVIKGGQPMKANPLCASVLAAVAQEIAGARLLAYGLAHLMAQPEDFGGVGCEGVYTFAQMIGARVQQACLTALNRGMELMGSAGYAREWHVEKHWRDIKTIQSHLAGVASEVPVMMDAARFFFDCKEV